MLILKNVSGPVCSANVEHALKFYLNLIRRSHNFSFPYYYMAVDSELINKTVLTHYEMLSNMSDISNLWLYVQVL